LIIRDSNIGAAVGFVAKTWKVSPTRNREQKVGRACAASIVRDALARGAGVHLSEADVVKAWDAFRKVIAKVGFMKVGDGEWSVMTTDFVGRIKPN
jgi:hypothetical protein